MGRLRSEEHVKELFTPRGEALIMELGFGQWIRAVSIWRKVSVGKVVCLVGAWCP